jgi:hypothetical protein
VLAGRSAGETRLARVRSIEPGLSLAGLREKAGAVEEVFARDEILFHIRAKNSPTMEPGNGQNLIKNEKIVPFRARHAARAKDR